MTWLLALALATAAEPGAAEAPEPEETPQAEAAEPEAAPETEAPTGKKERSYMVGGLGLPLVNFNTTDGLGFGVGAEIYTRPKDQPFGYRYKFTVSTFWTTSGNYTSNYFQVEHRGEQFWMTRLIYRGWRNMIYVGQGGDDVSRVRDPDEALGNAVFGPILLANVVRRVANTPISVFGQGYARYAGARAAEGGILEADAPFGLNGGFYFDVGAGMWIQEVDRWPLPNRGYDVQVSVRGGGTATEGAFRPLIGTNIEVKGWVPLVGKWLVLGGRSIFDKTWGPRPWWDLENLGGIDRDEVAYEQMLTGYGRSRSRGDGVFATNVELRTLFGRAQTGYFDMAFGLSVYGETAFLFTGNDPGPHMPSVGVAPELLWQGATILRPFIAWGWTREGDGDRMPRSQVGISLLSPL
jgi:hypothetical protein